MLIPNVAVRIQLPEWLPLSDAIAFSENTMLPNKQPPACSIPSHVGLPYRLKVLSSAATCLAKSPSQIHNNALSHHVCLALELYQ